MKIIAISGHAQNGKDTTAGFIKKHLEEKGEKVLIVHYADLLKFICTKYFEWDGKKDERGRHLLQYVGTDIIRAKEPSFWVDFVIKVLDIFGDVWDWVLIPDTRFPNEVDALKDAGFTVAHLRVHRGGEWTSPLSEEQQKHPSETALDNEKPDLWVNNNGTLEDLDNKIAKWVGGLYDGQVC